MKACTKKRPCEALGQVLTDQSRVGFSFPLVFNTKTSETRTGGLMFRHAPRARPVWCNFCPFCGVRQGGAS